LDKCLLAEEEWQGKDMFKDRLERAVFHARWDGASSSLGYECIQHTHTHREREREREGEGERKRVAQEHIKISKFALN